MNNASLPGFLPSPAKSYREDEETGLTVSVHIRDKNIKTFEDIIA